MDQEKFFYLDDPLASRPFRLSTKYSDWVTIQQANKLSRGRLRLDAPLKLNAYMGGQATDFLWTGFPPLVCVSTKVVNILRENNISGWSIYPVEVYDRKGGLLDDYWGFSIEKVKEIMVRAKISNVKFIALPELEIDVRFDYI